MFRINVLNRFNQRRLFWRRIAITFFILFDICFLLEITAFAILVTSGKFKFPVPEIKASTSAPPSSARRTQDSGKLVEKKNLSELINTEPVQQPSQLFAPPPSTIRGPNDHFAQQVRSEFVPMPRARPKQLASNREFERSDDLKKTNNANSTKQDVVVEQTRRDRQPSDKLKPPDQDARRTAALDLERSYLNVGISISTKISGPDGTILNLEFAQFDDALVQKIMSVRSFAASLRSVGFTTVIFTGAQNKNWVLPLAASTQINKRLQPPNSKKPSDSQPTSKLVVNPPNHPSNQNQVGEPLQLLQ